MKGLFGIERENYKDMYLLFIVYIFISFDMFYYDIVFACYP